MNRHSDTIRQAVEMLMADISSRPEWSEEASRGKMFGVLIVDGNDELIHRLPQQGTEVLPSTKEFSQTEKHEKNTVGALFAYSGQILGRSNWDGYVPAIFDYLEPDGYFKQHEAEITALNQRVREAEALLPKGKRSAEVERMKAERKERSNILQRWLFSQFVVTGNDGGRRSVLDIFADYAHANELKQQLPPGGTGECCAPKLLHYANSHHLRPIALTEFWYGASPKGEVRHHGHFYEPCQAKCQPILWYLMPPDGITVLGERMLSRKETLPRISKADIIFEDEWFVAINKPAGLLSVPGKRQMPNAETMLEILRPGIKMTHRLDQDTSGILLAAKSNEAFIAMQRLFSKHEEVRKEYVAVINVSGCNNVNHGDETQVNTTTNKRTSGTITLPLAPDFINRPRQCVDYDNGKEAITEYVFLAPDRVLLRPLTGRTHQLRMHCAHLDGLGMPIVGDPLYGNKKAERMYLHAQRLQFRHPFTGKMVTIESPAPF